MEDKLLTEASRVLRNSAFEIERALMLIRQHEEKATCVCDAIATLDDKSRQCIDELEQLPEQLYKLSEQVLSMDVVISPCRLCPLE